MCDRYRLGLDRKWTLKNFSMVECVEKHHLDSVSSESVVTIFTKFDSIKKQKRRRYLCAAAVVVVVVM